MDWNDVLDHLDEVPPGLLEQFELSNIGVADPVLSAGLRALQRYAHVRTLADLSEAPEAGNVLLARFPRQERRAFCKALSHKVRAIREGNTPLPPPVEAGEEVPRGGDELDAWAARLGVTSTLDQPVRLMSSSRDRSGTVMPLVEMLDVVRFPDVGKQHGLDREAVRRSALEPIRAAVRNNAPLVAQRDAFLARKQLPSDPWLVERITIFGRAIERLPTPKRPRSGELRHRYPHPAVRFESRPPRLQVVIGHAEHAVSLSNGDVENRSHHWHGSPERDAFTRSLLECAIDALCDPGAVVNDVLAWRATPAHEHLIADFQRSLGAPQAAAGDERVAFRVSGPVDALPQVVLQRPKKGAGFSAGRKVSAREALSTRGLTAVDREILELCVALEHRQYDASGVTRLKARLFDLLAEHPRVHLDDDARTPLRVRRARACLSARAIDGAYRVELVAGGVPLEAAARGARAPRGGLAFSIDRQTSFLYFAELDDAAMALLDALHANPDALSSEGLDAVLGVVATRPELDVDLALPEEVRGTPAPADRRLVVQLTLSGSGSLELAVRVRPIVGGTAFVPGAPPRETYAARDGKRIFAIRDLDDEEVRAERLLTELPLAGTERRSAFDVRTDDVERACDLVATLGELAGGSTGGVVLEWSGGSRLRVARTLDRRSLKLNIERKRDWFGIRGGVEVEGTTVDLRALLEAARGGRRYVRLGSGDLVAIDRELRGHLARAGDLLLETKDGIVAHPTALGAVESLVASADDQLVAAKEWLELRARVRAAESSEPELPAGLRAELRPYQLDGYRWLMRLAACGIGGCLADDMGLGKTLQSLALLAARAHAGPALIVAPTSVCANWVDEAARFTPDMVLLPYRGADRRKLLARLGPGTALVTSYDVLLRDIDELQGIELATAIFDEAHALKNAHAKRAAAVRRIRADVRFALTGTPVENHTGELWSLFSVVVPGLFGPWERFRDRFAGPIERERDASRQAALASVVQPYLLRRTKAAVAPELPPRTDVVRFVDLSPSERELYETERARALAQTRTAGAAAPEKGGDARFALLAALTRLRQLACHPRLRDPGSTTPSTKLGSVLALIDELKTAGHRALVFSQFTGHLAIVAEALGARGITFFELQGSTSPPERAERVRRFQAGEGDVFLISLKAGGTGLNLTAADYVIHLDPWWNPAAEDQASDRAHRIGQDKPVTVVRVISRATIEESVLALHAEKRELAEALLSGGDVAARLTTRELFALMEKTQADEASIDEGAELPEADA